MQKQRMKIGVDLDDVLANLASKLIDYYNKIDNTSYTVEDVKDYRLRLLWKCTQEENVKRIFDFYKSESFKTIGLVKGSQEGIDYLSNKYDLYVITSRPTWLEKETVDWVEKYFPNKFKDIILTNQVSTGEKHKTKSQVGKEIGISHIIEDHLDYIMDSHKEGIKVLVKDMPWNRKADLPEGVVRFYDWKEIEKYL